MLAADVPVTGVASSGDMHVLLTLLPIAMA